MIFLLRPTCLAALLKEAIVFSLILWCLENARQEVNGGVLFNARQRLGYVDNHHSLCCVWGSGSPVADVYRAPLLPVLCETGTHVTLQSLGGPDHQVVDWNIGNCVKKESRELWQSWGFWFHLALSRWSVWSFVPLLEVWQLRSPCCCLRRTRRGGRRCPHVPDEHRLRQHVHQCLPVIRFRQLCKNRKQSLSVRCVIAGDNQMNITSKNSKVSSRLSGSMVWMLYSVHREGSSAYPHSGCVWRDL